MSQEPMELAEKHPDKVEFYLKLEKDRENYLDDLKKLYNNVLQTNFSYMCLKLQLSSLLTTSKGLQMVLDHDNKEDAERENEIQTEQETNT